jgi:hypothetical protein
MSIDKNEEALRELGAEIVAMSKADQAMRKSRTWDASIDVKHTARMHQIVAAIGWPTISKVGQQASHMAWLLVQHADHDRDFQRACLALMRAQPAAEVNPQNIAYLEDRVRIGEGRPQLFGTQFHTNKQGELEPLPIENPEQVDARRTAIGLSTLAEYAPLMQTESKAKQKTIERTSP